MNTEGLQRRLSSSLLMQKSRHHGQQGIALLLVILVIGMLALQVVMFMTSVRDAMRLADNEMALARGEALAQGVVEFAAARLLAERQEEQWKPDGSVKTFDYAGTKVRLRMTDERSRVNLNYADEALLNGIFRVAAGSGSDSAGLTQRFLKWRNSEQRPGRGTSSAAAPDSRLLGPDGKASAMKLLDAADIGRILKAPAPVVEALLPLVTIYGPDSKINAMTAPEQVLAALPGITPQLLELALELRATSADHAKLQAALAPAGDRLVFATGPVVRLELAFDGGSDVSGRAPSALGGADVVIATRVDPAAPFRVLSWRLQDGSRLLDQNTDKRGAARNTAARARTSGR